MKVISLVPSLTETLVEAGVEVVGRTRYCIHPSQKIASIPILGGTKKIDLEKLSGIDADLLILDKEENPKSFAENSPIPFFATHIQDISTCADELERLGKALNSSQLSEYSQRYRNLKNKKVELRHFTDWVTPPQAQPTRLEYIIWRDPLMAVSRNTFIGSVLGHLGHELPAHPTNYPELADLKNPDTCYLFSSEPFPFGKHRNWIQEQAVSSGIVNGESFSWFGIRSLRFLEKCFAEI